MTFCLGPAVRGFKGSHPLPSPQPSSLPSPSALLPSTSQFPFPSHAQVLQVRQSCEGIVSNQCKLVGIE